MPIDSLISIGEKPFSPHDTGINGIYICRNSLFQVFTMANEEVGINNENNQHLILHFPHTGRPFC
jgi:hypothetical protein